MTDQKQRMFWQGSAFYEAGSALRKAQIDIPMIVVYCFGIEVYLKMLLKKTGGGHDLLKLYLQLPKVRKAAIIAEFEKMGKPGADFEERLRDIATAFQKWRYVYETPNEWITLDNVWDIATAVHRAVRVLEPTLE